MAIKRLFELLLLTGLSAGCTDRNDGSDASQTGPAVKKIPESVVESIPVTNASPDLTRESRLAEQIVDAIFDGEPLWLDAERHQFLGIHMESQSDASNKAALILHGRGYHPDWEQVVRPLRIGLTEFGWNTLSLQLPVLEKEAKYYEYIPILPAAFARIEAGIRYLEEQGNETIVLISHSCGVHMAMEWVRNRDSSAMDGFAGIGMGATDYKQPMKEPFPFEKITVPVLDVYGALDFPAVQNAAPDRLAAVTAAGNLHSKQIVLEDADHYMDEQDEELLEAVSTWLNNVFP